MADQRRAASSGPRGPARPSEPKRWPRGLGLLGLLLAAVVLSRFEGGGSQRGAEQDTPLPTFSGLHGPAFKPAQCDDQDFNKVCGDTRLLGGDLIEAPAFRNRISPSRIVITPEGRVRFEAKLQIEGYDLGLAARQYDANFERFGWLLDPGSPPSGTLVTPRKEVTRHYVGISTVPLPGQDSVVNKGFEATLVLTEVPATRFGAVDVLVEAVMQTIDPVPIPRQSRR